MEFSRPRPPRRPAENIVPMINVVFLLLIFFLMSAQIAPPVPVEITPPGSNVDPVPPEAAAALYLDADGTAYFDGLSGEAALAALAAAAPDRLTLHADADLPAQRLARLLPQLGAMGLERVDLLTRPQP